MASAAAIGEDITFLVLGAQIGLKGIHKDFLKVFWREEFEEGVQPIDNTKGRWNISRTKIRAEIESVLAVEAHSAAARASRVIHQTYSGYVHAASPHIMDIYGGSEFRFFLGGVRGTDRHREHIEDAWNYVYRGLLATQPPNFTRARPSVAMLWARG
jgi:hypothetical protein